MNLRRLKNVSNNITYALKAEHSRRYSNSIVIPREILLAVTYKCDSKCKTCGIWKKYQKNPKTVFEELTVEEFKRVVDNNKYLRGIAITGGEPFLREDLYDMVAYLDQKGYSVGITTNAIDVEHIMKETQRMLGNLSGKNPFYLQISVDGFEEMHDYIRGVKGNFSNAMMLLKWCMEQSRKYRFFRVAGVSHTLTDSNYQYLDKFVEYFVSLGLKPEQISFRPVSYSSVYYSNTRNSEAIKNNMDLLSVIKGVQDEYHYYKKDSFYKGMVKYLKNPNKRIVKCYAGITFCYVDPYLNVYPCIFMNSPMGNLRDYNFSLKNLLLDKNATMVKEVIKNGNCNCWSTCTIVPSLNSDPRRVVKNYIHKIIDFQ